tara:strand:+ start:6643 stop:6918 length:276 start_codon:yes stop_codon:yes gene_type:complete
MNRELALEKAAELIEDIMNGDVNTEDRCEKWLKEAERLGKVRTHNVGRISEIVDKIALLEDQWDKNDNNNTCNKFVQDRLAKLNKELSNIQ